MIVFLKTKVWPLLQETARAWQRDRCAILSAAMAHYALFSLFPLLLVMLSLAGAVLGDEDSILRQALQVIGGERVTPEATAQLDANQQLFNLLSQSLSEDAARQIAETLERLNENRTQAGLIGFLLLVWTSSRAFGSLQQAFQIIWDTGEQEPPEQSFFGRVLSLVRSRLLSFALVVGCALLLLVAMLTSLVITVMSAYTQALPGDWLVWRSVQLTSSLVILTLVFMLLFKYLPGLPVAWGDVWPGAFITGGLFTLFLQVSSSYIGQSDYQSYGAVGGIMALLLWIYLSSQALFGGAEFTRVYTRMYGSQRSQSAEPDAEASAAAPEEAADTIPPLESTDALQQQTVRAAGIGALAGVLVTLAVGVGALIAVAQHLARRLRGR